MRIKEKTYSMICIEPSLWCELDKTYNYWLSNVQRLLHIGMQQKCILHLGLHVCIIGLPCSVLNSTDLSTILQKQQSSPTAVCVVDRLQEYRDLCCLIPQSGWSASEVARILGMKLRKSQCKLPLVQGPPFCLFQYTI